MLSSPVDDGFDLDGAPVRLVEIEGRRLVSVPAGVAGLDGTVVEHDGATLRLVRPTAAVASLLRELLPGLRPRPLGSVVSSFGFGDRLGVATVGHVRALRAARVQPAPVLAQQSSRELARTGRTFEDVLDAAMWGVLETGWTSGYGADADHLHTADEARRAVTAGFTMLTLDPGEHLDGSASRATGSDLERRLRALPWEALEDDWQAMRRRHHTPRAVAASDLDLARAAATFGNALAHLADMTRSVEPLSSGVVDVEVSVDETDVPTSPFDHAFLAVELERLGVRLTSFAPRLPGRWEKGVDLLGDPAVVARALAAHVHVAAEHGAHKVSIHSGSDKFSVYPLLAETGAAWHVKTSGTSYLEALRVVAGSTPALFREVLALARRSLAEDRRSYAIAASSGVPDPSRITDSRLPGLLDVPEIRQSLHVTFGTVLTDARLGPGLHEAVESAAGSYADALERHFVRHLDPLDGIA